MKSTLFLPAKGGFHSPRSLQAGHLKWNQPPLLTDFYAQATLFLEEPPLGKEAVNQHLPGRRERNGGVSGFQDNLVLITISRSVERLLSVKRTFLYISMPQIFPINAPILSTTITGPIVIIIIQENQYLKSQSAL